MSERGKRIVGGLMSYLRYLCLFAHRGVQHILCCVFVLLCFSTCYVHYIVSFSGLSIVKCPILCGYFNICMHPFFLLRGYHTLQGDNSLKSVERFDYMMFVCRFQASRWSKPQREKLGTLKCYFSDYNIMKNKTYHTVETRLKSNTNTLILRRYHTLQVKFDLLV
jgi:hypothetical protein